MSVASAGATPEGATSIYRLSPARTNANSRRAPGGALGRVNVSNRYLGNKACKYGTKIGAPAPASASQAAPTRGGRRKIALRREATHRNEATGLAQQRDNPQKVHSPANNSNLVAQSECQHANIQFGLSRQLRSEDLTCSPHITWEGRLA